VVWESHQNVFFIQIDASSFTEFEISKFELSRFDCIFIYWENTYWPLLFEHYGRVLFWSLGHYLASVTRKGTFGHFTQCRPRSATKTMLKTPIRNLTDHRARNISAIDVTSVKKCRPWPDAASGDSAAGLGLHFLHRSEDPFSHEAGHISIDKIHIG